MLHDLTNTVSGDRKWLVAKVIKKSLPVFAGVHRYEVELYDTTCPDDVNIARELVWSGFVIPSDDSPINVSCLRLILN